MICTLTRNLLILMMEVLSEDQGGRPGPRGESSMPRPVSLSLDLLRTFLLLNRNDGDAAKTTRELGINQPSMSKRLKYLQHSDPRVLQRPWLYLDGKTWRLTEEGTKVLPAVE